MNENDLQEEINQLRKRNAELEDILNTIPASLYINQIDTIDDMTTGKNIWLNKFALDDIGYTPEEIDSMGFAFIETVMHPEDVTIAKDSINHLKNLSHDKIYKYVSRVKPKDKKYKWQYGHTCIFKQKPDGTPWQFLNVIIDIASQLHTENQLMDALNEINRLENALKLQPLSKRELEILKLIAQGMTDEEIAGQLFIGKGTVHTYRNKLLKKTGTTNTAALVAFAIKCGLG